MTGPVLVLVLVALLGYVPAAERGHQEETVAALSSLSTPSPTASRTLSPTSSPTATEMVMPTATTMPTETAAPTNTPLPTNTLAPTPTILLPTPDGITRTLSVPILMYHYLSVPPDDADDVRHDLSVTPEMFEQQLRYLKGQGYETISLEELALALQTGYALPDKPIILTFDDGYSGQYENALPLLEEYGFQATFFLITSVIDQGVPAYMSWGQVISLHKRGMEIGAHGYTHADLADRDVDYLTWQVLGSKEAIEERIGEPVRFFCYPSGSYDDLTVHVVASANYWGAVTISFGHEHRSDSMYVLERFRVHGDYTVEDLDKMLRTLQPVWKQK